MGSVFQTLIRVLFSEKASFKFALGVVLGLAFSVSVILGTIGIMDGFEHSLKKALKSSVGDLVFYSKNGFFEMGEDITTELEILNIQDFTSYIQTEGFLLKDETSKGVLIKGVEEKSFNKLTGTSLQFSEKNNEEIFVGSELLKFIDAKVGDEIVLALAGGNKDIGGMPRLHRFKISGTISHGIYQKDLRLVYVKKEVLQKLLGVLDQVNVVSANIPSENLSFVENNTRYSDKVEDYQQRLYDRLGSRFSIKPFWYEFSTLIRAVNVEKTMIGLILQLVVIISIFNVLAFVIFLNEKKSRELFLFKALGMSQARLNKAWLGMISFIWLISCSLSIFLVNLFNTLLQKSSFLELPGDVYYLGRLSIVLDWGDYALVFAITYLWIFGMATLSLFKIRKQSILKGLRKEFA